MMQCSYRYDAVFVVASMLPSWTKRNPVMTNPEHQTENLSVNWTHKILKDPLAKSLPHTSEKVKPYILHLIQAAQSIYVPQNHD